MKGEIFFIITVIMIIAILVIKILFTILRMKFNLSDKIFLGLTNYQIVYLLVSSVLFLLLFYLLKSYITDIKLDYVSLVAFFYMIWYLLTKMITNAISSERESI